MLGERLVNYEMIIGIVIKPVYAKVDLGQICELGNEQMIIFRHHLSRADNDAGVDIALG